MRAVLANGAVLEGGGKGRLVWPRRRGASRETGGASAILGRGEREGRGVRAVGAEPYRYRRVARRAGRCGSAAILVQQCPEEEGDGERAGSGS